MTSSIVEVIQHYQRSIDNSQNNEDRLLYCIKKLYKLPIKVEHLQETGVGKTVNSLRKFNGEIGVAAKSLVTKWKAMVAAEEEPMDTTPYSNDNKMHDDHNNDDDGDSGGGHVDSKEDENHNLNSSPENQKSLSGHMEKERQKERHKDSSSCRKHSPTSKHSEDKYKAASSSSSSKTKEGHSHRSNHGSSSSSKEREKEKTEHKSRDKHKSKHHDKHKEHSEKQHRGEQKQKSDKESKNDSTSHKTSSSNHSSKTKSEEKELSSSKDKHKSSSRDRDRGKEEKSSKDKHERKSSSSSHKSGTKDKSEVERKRRNTSDDNDSNDFKPPEPKVVKVKKSKHIDAATSSPQEDDEENSFDSSMGANFGDILGMLNEPTKKSKKSLKSLNSSNASLKDSPKPSTSNNNATKTNGVKTSGSIFSSQSMFKSTVAEKPDLLASTAKLAPLDPSIVLELPTISTNYKPMPLNQTVMDCVFNTSCSSASKPVRTLTDAEAYQHGISSKTMRTKIYSGVKIGQILQVPTLFDLCIRILQKNIDALEYTGGVPFEVLRPVLERATPQQLFIFEDYNPYLMEDSDVLWQTHVQRNYRTQKRIENESWREMFMRCQEEEERRLSVLKNNIKQSQKVAAAPIRKTQLAFVDSMVKPPRNVIRKQEQYGTKSKLVATPAARVASLQSVTPNAAKTGDQRLKVSPAVRDHAQVASSSMRPKKAPLMQKTLAFMRGRLKR